MPERSRDIEHKMLTGKRLNIALAEINLRKDNHKVVNGFIKMKLTKTVIQSIVVRLRFALFNYNCKMLIR